jgi:AAA domain
MSEPRRHLSPAQQRDVLAALDEIDRAKQHGPAETSVTTKEVFRLYTINELLDFPEPEWLVEPFLIDGSLSVLFGASGTFKSFVAVDWAARSPGVAVYLSAEGSPKRFGQRAKAWEAAAGRPSDIVVHPFAIDLLVDTNAFIASIRRACEMPPRLLVVDTASRNMTGDENKTADMAALVAALDRIRAELGSAVLVVHHSGHENTDRERGSSALRGAADISIRATKDQKRPFTVRLSCAKSRDAEEFQPRVVRLEQLDETLVACRGMSAEEVVYQDVSDYLEEHPTASQREVEAAVKGRAATIRLAYRELSQGASGASHRMDAPPAKVRPASVPLKGTRDAGPLSLDDGGW